MSIERCHHHDLSWDSDFLEECPNCSNEADGIEFQFREIVSAAERGDDLELEYLVSECEERFGVSPFAGIKH